MEGLNQENVELAMLKHYWQKYGKLLLGAILIIVTFMFGHQYWQTRKLKAAEQASNLYQEMVIADFSGDSKTAKASAVSLLDSYGNTAYAQLARLTLAKMYVSENDLDKAKDELKRVREAKGAKHFVYYIATARLAKVLQEEHKYDEALELVAKDPDPAYMSLYADVRGDLYVAKGSVAEAKQAYMQALNSAPEGMQPQVIQMKLLELGGDENA